MRGKLKPLKPGRTEAQVLEQTLQAFAMFRVDVARQNTGAMTNPSGRTVRFGTSGNSDISGMLPDGRKLDCEVKAESFDPRKVRGEARERFRRQLDRLRRTNEQGGVGFWTNRPEELPRVLARLLEGWRAEIDDDGIPWVTDEPGA